MSLQDASYYHAICPLLPSTYADKVRALGNSESTQAALDALIRFVVGAECSGDASGEARKEWNDKQSKARKALDDLQATYEGKRVREDDESDLQEAKRRRRVNEADLVDDGPPLFTWNSISVTSPVRKKVDITIYKTSIRFIHPSTQAVEATVSLSALRRAFVVPTRGKARPYWTVILLSDNMPSSQPGPQVIFGIDAQTLTPIRTTTYPSPSTPVVKNSSKGSDTLPLLHEFLSYLPPELLPVLEPSTTIFRSAVNTGGHNGGIPGVEAYRAAKSGSLWFFPEGILWGDSKPCEFWPVESLTNKTEGVRLVSATGRTCSVILNRKNNTSDSDEDGDETVFGMVDGREQPGINQWVRQHRHLFGKTKVVQNSNEHGKNGAANAAADDSDASDEDFAVNSGSSDGGSPTSDSSDESENYDSEGGSEEGTAESESDEADDEELREVNHPLLRPGAMPRMSRAAIDAVVNMVEQDLDAGQISDEEDELED